MPQSTSGLRSALSLPAVYDGFQRLIGAPRARALVVERYIRPRSGCRILDLGCGTGEILTALPAVEYHGCDLSAEYIRAAQARFGARGTFRCCDAATAVLADGRPFDLVLAVGLLHHLSDEEAANVCRLARSALGKGGRFVTWDACFAEGQSWLARFLVRQDRGRNVRTADQYRALAASAFPRVRATVHHDLLNIPYSHAILECEAD